MQEGAHAGCRPASPPSTQWDQTIQGANASPPQPCAAAPAHAGMHASARRRRFSESRVEGPRPAPAASEVGELQRRPRQHRRRQRARKLGDLRGIVQPLRDAQHPAAVTRMRLVEGRGGRLVAGGHHIVVRGVRPDRCRAGFAARLGGPQGGRTGAVPWGTWGGGGRHRLWHTPARDAVTAQSRRRQEGR